MTKNRYQILWEDEHFLLANEPSGLLTIPDRYRAELPNLYHLLQKQYPEIYIVHRLDKGTSGVVCFAKTKEAHRLLSQQFEARIPVKQYYALVRGVPYEDAGKIEVGLSARKEGGMRVDVKRGKPSITAYQVVEAFGHYALLNATILTGRTHQIRVHCKHLGHPLAVDPLYANTEALYLSEIKRKRFNLKKMTDERPLLTRVPLHAYRLELVHPISGATISQECPLPKDFRAVLNQLRKWDQKKV
jgi:23S rRNA pseudouridine955/2504/2580 synthase/23S rRNA pseudouridine1911/1915/1917 synthase